jgi:phosphoglycolate phosphatase
VENPFIGLSAVLFDLDGTLIDTHIDFDLMKREMLRLAENSQIDSSGFEGLDILTIVERCRHRLAQSSGTICGDAFRARAFAILEEIEVSHCAHPVEIPGARELLDTLDSRGIRIGIVTRNCRRVSQILVRDAGLRHHALLTRDDVERTKPDPAHLYCALSAMGLDPTPDTLHPTPDAPHPTPYLMVGDHWMDVLGGRAAGMRTVGLLRGRPASFFVPAPPDHLVQELRELVPLATAA